METARSRILVGVLLAAALIVAGGAARAHLRSAALGRQLRAFDVAELPEHGRMAYELLVQAELVDDTYNPWGWTPIEAPHRLFDLWDLPEVSSTPIFLALCEHGTPAARFYGLAGLSGSDPWTFERALERYGHGTREVDLSLGCIGLSGEEQRMIREHIVEGALAKRWRGMWSRTVRIDDGPDPWRDLREEFRR